MKKLAQSVLLLSSSQFATTAVRIVRNKILAVLLGPKGLGLLSQLQQFQLFASGVIPMGMQVGALKYMAKSRATGSEHLHDQIKTASRFFLVVSIVSVLICLLLVKPISGKVLGNVHLYLYLIPAILGVGFIVQSDLWSAYLQAGIEMKALAAATMCTAAVGLVVVVPLVFIWRESGAAFYLLLSALFGFVFLRLWSNRSMGKETRILLKRARFRWEFVIGLSRFAGANLLTFALSLGVPFLVSTQIIRDCGFSAKGIYQVVFSLASGYIMVPLNAINTYELAKISQLEKHSDINNEVNSTLKLAILINVFLVMSVLVAGDLVIRALYSSRFLPALTLLPWMMIACFFRFYAYVIGAPILPMEFFRARNVICALQYAAFLAVFYFVPANMRLQGAVWAECANWIVASVSNYVYLRGAIGLRIDKRNLMLSAWSLVALVVVASMPYSHIQYRLTGVSVLVLWAILSVKRSEMLQLKELVFRRRS